MVWRCRNSAAANRRALHPDYTSATEKTPTPLNRRCTRPQNPPCFAPNALHFDIAQGVDAHDSSVQTREFFDPPKTLIESMFSRISGIQFWFRASDENCVLSTRTPSQTVAAVSVLPRQKFFSTDALFGALQDGACDQNRANRLPSDSRFGTRTMPRVHRNRASRSVRECAEAKLTTATPLAPTSPARVKVQACS
jgi:hypothetical protein